MKVVVIGGTGIIGSHIVEKLNAHGHGVKPAALVVAAARADSVGHYVGTGLADDSLVPGPDAWLASTTYDDWATANGS